MKYFKRAYNRNIGCDIEDISWGIDLCPTMFNENQNNILFSEVSEQELLATMKYFQKDKCLVLDGWTIDFFIHFLVLFKSDLLNMVEESRIHGYIIQYISSTYITLIPKKKVSTSFTTIGLSHCATFYIRLFQKLLLSG